MSLQAWWKPVAIFLAAVVIVGTAWTRGVDLVSSTFLATDTEVGIAVGVITKRIDETIDPQIIELSGAVEILTRGQAKSELTGLNAALQQADTQLFDVRERRKVDPGNPDAKVRELQLIRLINDLTQDQRAAKCSIAMLDNSNAIC